MEQALLEYPTRVLGESDPVDGLRKDLPQDRPELLLGSTVSPCNDLDNGAQIDLDPQGLQIEQQVIRALVIQRIGVPGLEPVLGISEPLAIQPRHMYAQRIVIA